MPRPGVEPRPPRCVRLGLLATLVAFGVTGLSPAAPDGDSRPAPYRLVQRDGTVVELSAPPREKGGLLVGTLHPSGRLVSIPKASLDSARTAEANRGDPPPTPRPAPAAKGTGRGTVPLGTSHPLNRTADEARRLIESARAGDGGGGPPPDRVPPARAGGTEGEGDTAEEEPRDRSGRTEAWWRRNAGESRRRFEAAVSRLRAAEAALEAAERADLLPGDAQRTTFVVRVLEARQAADQARAEEARARKSWDEMQEDARRSGTPPGWLR